MMDHEWIIKDSARQLREIADVLEGTMMLSPYIDRVAEMPINSNPTQSQFVRNFGERAFWPLREQHRVTGLTIHHTMSHSPLGTATYCAFTKGYPTVQYHYWVSADDDCPIYRLADEQWMLWHDHTGTYQTTLAIGLAGRWDYYAPSDPQLKALVELVSWAMLEFDVPLDQVRGHIERARAFGVSTVCPGWSGTEGNGDLWRSRFYDMLSAEMGHWRVDAS